MKKGDILKGKNKFDLSMVLVKTFNETEIKGFGLNANGQWVEFGNASWIRSELVPATVQEFETVLVQEAAKRGFKLGANPKTKCATTGDIWDVFNVTSFELVDDYSGILMMRGDSAYSDGKKYEGGEGGGMCILTQKGTWDEVIGEAQIPTTGPAAKSADAEEEEWYMLSSTELVLLKGNKVKFAVVDGRVVHGGMDVTGRTLNKAKAHEAHAMLERAGKQALEDGRNCGKQVARLLYRSVVGEWPKIDI